MVRVPNVPSSRQSYTVFLSEKRLVLIIKESGIYTGAHQTTQQSGRVFFFWNTFYYGHISAQFQLKNITSFRKNLRKQSLILICFTKNIGDIIFQKKF